MTSNNEIDQTLSDNMSRLSVIGYFSFFFNCEKVTLLDHYYTLLEQYLSRFLEKCLKLSMLKGLNAFSFLKSFLTNFTRRALKVYFKKCFVIIKTVTINFLQKCFVRYTTKYRCSPSERVFIHCFFFKVIFNKFYL